MTTEFELTEQHIILLRHAYVDWDGCEFGAPAIDCKRPYGNSDVYTDLARLLHPEFDQMREGAKSDWLEDNSERLRAVHDQTQTALEILLSHGRLHIGRYVREPGYGRREWRPVDA